jgi:citronellol/citronellal dehydrogenase
MFEQGLYRGEVAVVTGGGTGLGLAVAREMGRLGAQVALCGRRAEPLEQAEQELQAEGIETLQDRCDIRDPDAVARFVDDVLAHFGRISVLVNNAGGQFPAPAEHISSRGFEAVVRNNLLGTWNMTHAVANRALIPQKRGRIVHVIASIARGFPGMAHTGAARAGVENLAKTLAVEWAAHGIRVNAVAPGVVETSGTAQYPPELLERARRSVPLGRMAKPEEVAHLITYLGSKQADYITGQSFYIDGGQSLWGDFWEVPEDVPQSPPEQ